MLAEVGLWLAKTLGAEQIKRMLGRRGLQAENRSLKKALSDSQQRREELEGAFELLSRLVKERDQLQAEVIRLRVKTRHYAPDVAGGRSSNHSRSKIKRTVTVIPVYM